MSDFIFSSSPTTRGRLSRMLQSIYHMDPPEVKEFHGSWGSLAASRNQYQGFAPLENGNHICIVSGGPVLTSSDNDFLTGPDDTAGTRYILDEWLNNNGCLSWDADLSGPFLVLILPCSEDFFLTHC